MLLSLSNPNMKLKGKSTLDSKLLSKKAKRSAAKRTSQCPFSFLRNVPVSHVISHVTSYVIRHMTSYVISYMIDLMMQTVFSSSSAPMAMHGCARVCPNVISSWQNGFENLVSRHNHDNRQ